MRIRGCKLMPAPLTSWLTRSPYFFGASLAAHHFRVSTRRRERGRRTDDPAAVIEGPKRGRALPKMLTIVEVDRLLAQARTDMDARAPRAATPPRRRAAW